MFRRSIDVGRVDRPTLRHPQWRRLRMMTRARILSVMIAVVAGAAFAGCAVDDDPAGAAGALHCRDSNLDADGSTVVAFHDTNRCVQPDLDHEWTSVHREANFDRPNATRRRAPMDGFVRVNDETEQHDGGVETPTDD